MFGIFSDEGCLETGFYSLESAEAAVADRYADEDEVTVCRVCPDHNDQPADSCEHCHTEEDEETAEEDEDDEDDEGEDC